MANEVKQVQLSALSVNIRGLNDRKKRRNVFRWVKKNKYDLCFLQETYSSQETECIWKNEWGGQIVFSHGGGHSRGILILIKPGLDAKVTSILTDNIGRFLLVDTMIQDTQFKLVNIYAPNSENDQLNFYHYIQRQLNTNTQVGDNILMGGDFNFIQNPEMDRKGGALINPTQKRTEILKTLEDIKEYLSLKDIWRIRNPHTRRFTWRRNNPLVKSRLDYWLTSETVEDSIKECEIIPFNHTDHSAVTLKIQGDTVRPKGRGLWRLNTSFLSEETYIKGILDKHNEWKDEFKEVDDPRVKWELLKYRIRQYSIKYGQEKARRIKNTETEIETELKAIEEAQDIADAARGMELENRKQELKNKLDEITDYKTQGLILRSQTDWYEKGEKSTKYFLRMEKRNQIKKEMRRLQKDNGTFTSDQQEILELQREFYQVLYSNRDVMSRAEMENYLESINTAMLNNLEKESCEGRLTAAECKATLKTFKPNKAPGNDGLPIEFYNKFWPIFSSCMLESFNYAYENGELSTSQRQATITLLDKGKDRTQLKNWRPISLLNSDYKIMSKAIANRFTKYLSQLIPENQTGFIKGRNIADNLRTLSDIIQYLKDMEEPGILINIDFQKAFDSLSWDFMVLTLKKFNFGPSFIQWIKTLYSNISSCIINNGHTSKFFQVERGVRQGDPLSPYLFILVAEIMACKVRQEKDIEGMVINKAKEIKLLQYADDTSGILKDLKSAKHFLKIVKEFGQYSGLLLNTEKTEGMWLGSNHTNKTKPLGISWPDRALKVLGVHFSYNQEECEKLNFIDKMDKVRRILNMWQGRNLTLYGRAQIVKTLVTSQFLYAASVIHTPKQIIKDINKLIFNFIWRNKKERLKRTVLVNKYEAGGLQVPDFQTMLNTTRLKWMQKIIKTSDTPYRLILEEYLTKLDVNLHVLLYSNYSMKSTGLDKGTLPEFYRELLTLWSEVGDTAPTNKANLIWYNKSICVNGRSLFYKDLFHAGIWYISDLFQAGGEAVPFQTWVERGVKRCSLMKWMGLVKKIVRYRTNCKTVNEEPQHLSLLSKGPLSQMDSKTMYNQLLAHKTGPETVVPRIAKYVNTDGLDWKEIFVRANKFPIDTKTKTFQYRFLYDILSNKYWLNKWHLAETATCTYCNSDIEDIVHMFWTCDKTHNFWQQFTNFCNGCNILSSTIEMEDAFLGVKDKRLCTLLFSAKQFIYNKRTHEEPLCFNAFKNILSNIKNIEFRISKENNRTEDWAEKWSFLP